MSQESTKTPFREQSEKYQRSKGRTRSDAIFTASQAIALAVVGVVITWYFPVLLIFVFGLSHSFVEFSELAIHLAPKLTGILWVAVVLILRILAVVWVAWRLVILARALIKPVRPVRCPKCNLLQEVYKSTKRLICPNCGILLVLGEIEAHLVPCSYCGLQTGIVGAASEFLCPNCGVSRGAHGLVAPDGGNSCGVCGSTVPPNALYCRACGTILQMVMKTDRMAARKARDRRFPHTNSDLRCSLRDIYDMDWQSGQDAIGHFYFGKAIVTAISTRVSCARSLDDVDGFLRDLALALVSFEEAAASPAELKKVAAYAHEIDEIYVRLLWTALFFLQGHDPDDSIPRNALPHFSGQTYLKPRRRLEAQLSVIGSDVFKWSERILYFSEFRRQTVRKGKKTFRGIRSYSALERDIVAYAARVSGHVARPCHDSPRDRAAPAIISPDNTTFSTGVFSTFAIITIGVPAISSRSPLQIRLAVHPRLSR